MKTLLIRLLRLRILQPIWQQLHHYSLIGMNYWASDVGHTGEKYAIRLASSKFSADRLPVVFDVGANIGQFSMMCIENFQQPIHIYAFEPSRNTFNALNDVIRNSHVDSTITPVHAGISDTNGVMHLYSSEPNSSIASVYNLKNPIREFNTKFTEEIKVITIDDFCSENQIEFIDYLKLDIEGHEFKALLGCQRMLSEKRIHTIQFEFGEGNIDSQTFFRNFWDLLHENYSFFRIVPAGLVKIPCYSAELEVFATINFMAELKNDFICA